MRSRREFLWAGANLGLGAVLASALPGVSFGALPGARPFVVVILRGALPPTPEVMSQLSGAEWLWNLPDRPCQSKGRSIARRRRDAQAVETRTAQ